MRSRLSPLALSAVVPVFALNLIPTCGGGGGGGVSPATRLEVEPNDGQFQANSILVGQTIQGDVTTTADQDWFILHLIAGRTVRIELFGTRLDQSTWDAAGTVPRLTLYYPNGGSKVLEHSFLTGWTFGAQDFDIPLFRVSQTGYYWVVVTPDNGLGGGRYALRVSYTQPTVTQFELEQPFQFGVDDTPGTAQALNPGTLAGFHRQGNDDYYALTVPDPRVLRVEIVSQRNGSFTNAPTEYDPLLRLYDVDGSTLLRENDDAFFHDPAIQYEVQRAGTYFLQVTQSPASTDSAPYFLLYSSDPTAAVSEIEPNDTPAGADPVAYGQNVSGTIAPGTEDWFQFVGQAGDLVRLQVFDKNTSQSASEAIQVSLVASDGTTPVPFHEGPAFQVLTTILQQNGVYYVRTQPGAAAVGSTSYRLELRRFHTATYEVEPNDTIATANVLSSGGFAAGVIATAGDHDLYRFTTTTNELVTFDVFADDTATGSNGFSEYSGYGSDLDPLLTIRDSTGAVVASSTSEPAAATFTESVADGLPTAALSFVAPPTSHVFYLDVTSADGSGGVNHFYAVRRR